MKKLALLIALVPVFAHATGYVDFSAKTTSSAATATVPVPGSIVSLSGILGIEKGKHGFSAGVIDLTAYTFTGVPFFKTLDLHLFGGLGVNSTVNGAVTGGGGLGRSFKLADQAVGFVDLGFAWLQGIGGPSLMVQAGIVVHF